MDINIFDPRFVAQIDHDDFIRELREAARTNAYITDDERAVLRENGYDPNTGDKLG